MNEKDEEYITWGMIIFFAFSFGIGIITTLLQLILATGNYEKAIGMAVPFAFLFCVFIGFAISFNKRIKKIIEKSERR